MPPLNPSLQTFPTYEELIPKAFAPPWLAGKYGTLWHRAIGQRFDIEWGLARDAAKVGFPNFTPVDALGPLGSERMLERIPESPNIPGETELAYRNRLKNVWGAWGAPLPLGSAVGAPDAKPEVQHYALPQGIWEKAGSPAAHRDSFGWCSLTNVHVFRQHEWTFPPYLVSDYFFAWEHKWATFWVAILPPHPFTLRLWGAGFWGDGGTWGSSATVAEVALLKRLVLTFKSQHSSCNGIVLVIGGAGIWGFGTWGVGVWGGAGTTTVVWPIGEPHWYP